MAGADLPSRAIREQITSALDLVVHVRRYEDGVRRIASISEVTGLEAGTPLLQDLFVYRTQGSKDGRLVGRFEATGIVPRFVHALRAAGEDIPLEIFAEPTGEARANP
jgi:pilus assembly protein CpaF